ncbi:permease [Acuticoccus kandeliae]|uniref:permease n=1 Tax=Acuticoccus kandeliae TaxID=2073160 RepID=UPI000D3E5883|nr:permease [Acuticoccus kandeliae]
MGALLFVGALTLASGLACYLIKGPAVFADAAFANAALLLEILPRIAAALIILGLVQVLLPRDAVARRLGRASGLRGLLLATVLGALTFGGPMTSFPIVAVLAVSGADIGAVIAFLTGWSLLGLSRIVVWELPILGSDFVTLRLAVSLAVPILAGLLARWVEERAPVRIKGVPPA